MELIDEFGASLKDFNKLKRLELQLNNNLITKLPGFNINSNNN